MLNADFLNDTKTTPADNKPTQKPPIKNSGLISAQDTRANKHENNGLSFFDLLDVINPLQHIPIISSLYRHITNDEIRPMAKMLGGAFFRGPTGAIASLIDVLVEANTGKDIGDHAASLLISNKFNGDTSRPNKTDVSRKIISGALAKTHQKNDEHTPKGLSVEKAKQAGLTLDKGWADLNRNQLDSNTQCELLQICSLKSTDSKLKT